MQSTRLRILEYLERNRQATAPELSQVLDLTQANIRHHLDVLERDGKIEAVGEVASGGRGRPTTIYMTARAEQRNALEVLASLLLHLGQDGLPARRQEVFLKGLADRLAGNAQQAGSLTIRLSTATQYLNDFHYKAHWEAHADAPQIFLGHCPYGQIITQHPELCRMDELLLERLTGEKLVQLEKQTRSPEGPSYCRFVIKPG
jgi:predicted ArsR family transcriptional regulator